MRFPDVLRAASIFTAAADALRSDAGLGRGDEGPRRDAGGNELTAALAQDEGMERDVTPAGRWALRSLGSV